jgi:cytochrome c1
LGAASASGPGIGNTENKANQGLSDGSLYANSFYGSDKGNPNGIGFGLAGRSLVGKGTVTPDCNEEGRVVVAITVDPSGKVIAADPGVKGTTNNAPCLLEPAAATAYLYQWAADSKAPAKQIGFVVINFKLGQ